MSSQTERSCADTDKNKPEHRQWTRKRIRLDEEQRGGRSLLRFSFGVPCLLRFTSGGPRGCCSGSALIPKIDGHSFRCTVTAARSGAGLFGRREEPCRAEPSDTVRADKESTRLLVTPQTVRHASLLALFASHTGPPPWRGARPTSSAIRSSLQETMRVRNQREHAQGEVSSNRLDDGVM